jgi:hypothetical protein
MTKARLTFLEDDIRVIYPPATQNRIRAKYSIDFEIDGGMYHCWNDKKGNVQFTFPQKARPQLATLIEEVNRLIDVVDASTFDVRKFLVKYMVMELAIQEELLKLPFSVAGYETTNVKPLDMDSLSVEDQSLLEVLQEQTEKAHAVAAAKGGKPEDGVTVTFTKDMVKAKLEEKIRQKK